MENVHHFPLLHRRSSEELGHNRIKRRKSILNAVLRICRQNCRCPNKPVVLMNEAKRLVYDDNFWETYEIVGVDRVDNDPVFGGKDMFYLKVERRTTAHRPSMSSIEGDMQHAAASRHEAPSVEPPKKSRRL